MKQTYYILVREVNKAGEANEYVLRYEGEQEMAEVFEPHHRKSLSQGYPVARLSPITGTLCLYVDMGVLAKQRLNMVDMEKAREVALKQGQ